MSALGVFSPGGSVLHRLPAGVKLSGLALCGIGSVWVDEPWQVGVAWVGVAVSYAVARVSWRLLVGQLKPLLLLLATVAAFQVLVSGWEAAVVIVGVIAALVALAGLVTVTTRTEDLVNALVVALGPLRHVGVDPERVGLLLALSIRSVAVVVGLAHEVRDAQRARGGRLSARAFAAPLIIRALRHADDLGEAMVARGVDD